MNTKSWEEEFDQQFTLASGTSDIVLLKEGPERMKRFIRTHFIPRDQAREVLDVLEQSFEGIPLEELGDNDKVYIDALMDVRLALGLTNQE